MDVCLENVDTVCVKGNMPLINSLHYHSGKVKKGSVFFAMPGIHTDGKLFINDAVKNGAAVIVHEGVPEECKDGVCYIQVEDVRKAMSAIAGNFFEHPSADMGIIGVTGTEGKSSTVSFIFQLLNLCGKKSGFFSTVNYSLGGEIHINPEHQTTPESVTVQERLAAMRDNGCAYAVVESSSHGLSPKTARLQNVLFDAGVCLNVTQEHLEFHGTIEQYKFDKANLFRNLDLHEHEKSCGKIPSFGVVNAEDGSAEYFRRAVNKDIYSFFINDRGIPQEVKNKSFFAEEIEENEKGISFQLCRFINGIKEKRSAHINLAGKFNVQNILAAMLSVHHITGIKAEDLIPLLPMIKPVKGRMCTVNEGQDFEVLIDYAHTPSSFMTIFPPISERIHKKGGRVLSLFGSGGERDTQKRPEQGRIAGDYSDIIVLADEDPRGEDSAELLEMIAAGCPQKKRGVELFIIPKRQDAIRKIFSLAKKGDIVMLLGKGHENSIIFKDRAEPYDEEETARTLLKDYLKEKLKN